VESEKYDTLTVNELFSKLKSAEVDRGMTAKLEGPTIVWTSLAHYLGGYQDQLLGGPLRLLDLRCTTPDGVKHKDYRGEVLG
jgi:hypothetical protein